MIKEVWYPLHLIQRGLTKNHKGADVNWNIGAGDTETVNGVPFTLQFSFDGKYENAKVLDVEPTTILPRFILELEAWARRDACNVIFFHNLRFDVQALLYDPKYRHHFAKADRTFVVGLSWKMNEDEYNERVARGQTPPPGEAYQSYIQMFADKTWFAKIHLSSRRTAWLIDSRSYFPSSLEEAAKLVGSPFLKLDKPRDLGKRNLRGDADFEEYARHDVLAQYYLGKAIYDQHQLHDVKLGVSLPHFASRVFRHHHFEDDDSIPFPPKRIAWAAEKSYHGGLNAMPVPPGWYTCTEIDINSAYPWAMTQLPSPFKGEYVPVGRWEDVAGQPGIVRISGEVNCRYGCIFTHDFKKIEGRFDRTWVTTYEVESALKNGCLKLETCEGWVWVPDSTRKPFNEFALKWWDEKKRHLKGTVGYHIAKIVLNSLYGKLVSTNRYLPKITVDERLQIDLNDVYQAGTCYNPVYGSWITGLCRQKLHDMMHLCEVTVDGKFYPALHASTDSIKTMRDVRELPDIGPGLGQWSVEIEKSPCLMLRPKLYIHEKFGSLGECRGKDCPKCHGKGCVKAALHGFRGNVTQLFEAAGYITKGKPYEYLVQHCWTMRQSLIRKKKPVIPLNFEMVRMSLQPVATG